MTRIVPGPRSCFEADPGSRYRSRLLFLFTLSQHLVASAKGGAPQGGEFYKHRVKPCPAPQNIHLEWVKMGKGWEKAASSLLSFWAAGGGKQGSELRHKMHLSVFFREGVSRAAFSAKHVAVFR